MLTGLTPTSAQNYQLNAGIFIKDFAYETATDAKSLLALINAEVTNGTNLIGATLGGGSFQCTPTIRQIEADGMRAPIIGSTVNDGWTVKMTGTMKEITAKNLKDALLSADITTTTNMDTVKVRNEIKTSDYISKLVWIGDKGDNEYILISIENALNLTGANMVFTDKGEATLPFEYQAHQADLTNAEFAPCEIITFSVDGEA